MTAALLLYYYFSRHDIVLLRGQEDTRERIFSVVIITINMFNASELNLPPPHAFRSSKGYYAQIARLYQGKREGKCYYLKQRSV